MFGIFNTNTGAETDKSGWYQWSVPAVVSVKRLDASSRSGIDLIGLAISGVLITAGLGLLVTTRRKKS
jgi:hypothetical protein